MDPPYNSKPGSLSSFLIDSILSASPAFYVNRPPRTPQVMDLRLHHLPAPAHQTLDNNHQQQSHPQLHPELPAKLLKPRKQQQLPLLPLQAPLGRQERRRNRTMFSEWQLANLEWRFARNKYLTTNDRLRIAKTLRLDQLQVKTWFQNRRMKWKKQILASGIQKSPTKPKGRPKRDSIPPIDDRLLPTS